MSIKRKISECGQTTVIERIQASLIHLRLHFQLLLAPIFLWGFFLAEGTPNGRFVVGFISFHLFLYAGMTAFNSYFDRDDGPVGGLERPPEVYPELLPFSLIIQGIGFVLALTVNGVFALIYVVIFVLGVLYSAPNPRLKSRPISGLLTVCIGQGILAGMAGAAPRFASLTALDWMGLLAAAGLTTAFYPITQIYQVNEDTARGDITFAAWAKPLRTFQFSISLIIVSSILILITFYALFGFLWTLLLGLFSMLLISYLVYWAIYFDAHATLANFRRVMRLYTLMMVGFLLFLVMQLFLVWRN